MVHDAIQQLIVQKRRHNQKDGVVYDENGTVIATDPDRVGVSPTSGEPDYGDGH
jgi:hypothetical protein